MESSSSREPSYNPPITSSPNFPNYYHPFSAVGGGGDQSYTSSVGIGGGGVDPATRKKRGRPRKYSPPADDDGNSTALGLSSPRRPNPNNNSEAGGAIVVSGSETSSGKKGRGRPPGSGKRQLDALGGQAGIGFTPHVILVNAGEDITSKIKAFSQQGPRTICILSANGATSNASICTSSLSGSSVTYEGRYEIISLEGSFSLSESNGGRGRTGGMSVTLAGPDGRVFGGSVSGMLIAASPVQVIVGSFIEDGKKPKYVPSSSSPPVPNILNFGHPVATSSPPSQQPSSQSSDENGGGSPYDGGSVPYSNDNQQPIHNMPMYSGWGNSNINMHPH